MTDKKPRENQADRLNDCVESGVTSHKTAEVKEGFYMARLLQGTAKIKPDAKFTHAFENKLAHAFRKEFSPPTFRSFFAGLFFSSRFFSVALAGALILVLVVGGQQMISNGVFPSQQAAFSQFPLSDEDLLAAQTGDNSDELLTTFDQLSGELEQLALANDDSEEFSSEQGEIDTLFLEQVTDIEQGQRELDEVRDLS
ncbi:MAG: hypothetical protein WCP97_06300 [bacterium]